MLVQNKQGPQGWLADRQSLALLYTAMHALAAIGAYMIRHFTGVPIVLQHNHTMEQIQWQGFLIESFNLLNALPSFSHIIPKKIHIHYCTACLE